MSISNLIVSVEIYINIRFFKNFLREDDIIKKSLIILILFISCLILIPSVFAADLSNDTLTDDGDDIVVSDDGDSIEKKEVNLTVEDKTWIYGLDAKVNVNVRDSDGNNVTGGVVTFDNVFNRNYTVNVSDGLAAGKLRCAGIGLFNITCRYIGNEYYNNASTVFQLNIPYTNTTCHNMMATRYNDTVYFTGNVVCDYRQYDRDIFDEYEEVTEGNLTIYVDDEYIGTCAVDINGNFVFIWNTTRNLIGQTINFKANYTHANNCFNSSVFSKSFTFSAPEDTKIITHVDVLDVGEILITGSVSDSSGNKVIGGLITYNNIPIAVDTNGNFKFYLTSQSIPEAKYEMGFMDWGSKADITQNVPLMNAITHNVITNTTLTGEIIDLCKNGTPYIKFGNGNGKTLVMVAGLHGGELAPQLAAFKLINLLAQYGGNIDGTIYIFPVLFPQATANNTRVFNYTNLNSVANVNGSISNSLVKFALSVNAAGLGDFHATRHSDSDVGTTSVLCSYAPTYESFLIGDFISKQTGYINYTEDMAAVSYPGALEDHCNINSIPAVTCEVLTNHRAIEYGSPEVSFNMMRAFLKYFGLDTDDLIKLPFSNEDMNLIFTSPYNYNPSSVLINKSLFKNSVQITANSASFIINYGGKYSITLKNVNGKPITGKTVIFTLNGKNIASVKTDSKGVATVKLTSGILKTVKAGKKNMIVKFNGDANYNSVTKNVKITVNKEKTKITAKNKKFKKSKKIKKYTITLKDKKGKAIKKAEVTIKVGKKTFKAKTTSKGKATFKLTKLNKKAKYTAKITYKGNKYYNKVTKKAKIYIK